MNYYEAPESAKYHGGYDPSNPPQGEHWCSKCSHWDDECICDPEEEESRPELEGLAKPIAQPHVTTFKECFENTRPWSYDSHAADRLLIKKVGRLTISPFCLITGLQQPYRSLSVIPADWVYSRIKERMIDIDDIISFEVIDHGNGWALVTAHYNKILGSAWLAYIKSDTIPE